MFLRLVKIHEYYLRNLEKLFPDIPRHEKDSNGNFLSSGPTTKEANCMIDEIKNK